MGVLTMYSVPTVLATSGNVELRQGPGKAVIEAGGLEHMAAFARRVAEQVFSRCATRGRGGPNDLGDPGGHRFGERVGAHHRIVLRGIEYRELCQAPVLGDKRVSRGFGDLGRVWVTGGGEASHQTTPVAPTKTSPPGAKATWERLSPASSASGVRVARFQNTGPQSGA